AVERRYYMLLAGEAGRKDAEAALRERAVELVQALARAEVEARLLDDAALLQMLHVWSHPATAAFERPEFPGVTTFAGGETA
ncbi:MAG: hypothetical protein K6U79_11350, partial [Firmicutes bacterium]|nr:hypothetical protein [Bacillota bacterium]